MRWWFPLNRLYRSEELHCSCLVSDQKLSADRHFICFLMRRGQGQSYITNYIYTCSAAIFPLIILFWILLISGSLKHCQLWFIWRLRPSDRSLLLLVVSLASSSTLKQQATPPALQPRGHYCSHQRREGINLSQNKDQRLTLVKRMMNVRVE
jgi:hypothetical protein